MFRSAFSIAATAVFLSVPFAGHTQEMLDAKDPDALLAVVKYFGSASLEPHQAGDPLIKGTIQGTRYSIFFYGCTDGQDCTNLQFSTAWVNPGHVTLETLNTWNRDTRFGKAYLDNEGDPALEMNISLDGGVTSVNFEDSVDWWRLVLTKFRDDIIEK